MIRKIFLALVVLIAVLVVVILTRPSDFRVSRSATIGAPTPVVFSQVNDLRKWNSWSPWAKLDPNAKNTLSGPAEGTGAKFGWSGNNEVGEGEMTITESRPNELVRFRLDFVKPMKSTSDTEFTFKPEANGTQVTWTMSGKQNFIGKAMSLVMDCDKMIGGYFEKGFENLEKVAQAEAKK